MPDTGWPRSEPDLTTCDREPIHLLGHVQSYGALIALSADWIIQHASTNVDEYLGLRPDDLIGSPLSECFSPAFSETLRDRTTFIDPDESSVRVFGVAVNGRDMDISVHRSGRSYIVEFEPRKGDRELEQVTLIYPLLSQVRNAASAG